MNETIRVRNPESPQSDRGFTLFIATLALIVAMGALLAVAFKLNGGGSPTTLMHGSRGMASNGQHGMANNGQPMMQAGGAAAGSASEEVKLVVKSDEEHGKKGSDGNWHDAYLPGDFSVKPGATVEVTVVNYDESDHSFTAPELGTNVIVAAGSKSKPSVTTFTFHAPDKAGRYEWFCAIPCDPWAMGNDGFMRGYVTVA
jgi:plastocyanin